mmetsp:Transcript_15217/g.33981  ORF Transcript_15217/g.33981 Transcript_15217/m.33981 type:complete len:214 (-) Transcript_15217:866-1507(-)
MNGNASRTTTWTTASQQQQLGGGGGRRLFSSPGFFFPGPPPSASVDVEPGGLELHGQGQVRLEVALGLVQGQVDAVEAGVRAGEDGRLHGQRVHGELADVAVVALQDAEALGRHTRGASDKLQQSRLLLRCEIILYNAPEPLDHLVVGLPALVLADILGVPPPVVQVDGGQPAQQQLQLLEVEDREQRLGHHLVEPREQRRQLRLHAPAQPVP